MYTPLIASRTETIPVRGLTYHVHRWGQNTNASAPVLVLLHGWADVGASYQFIVDALGESWVGERAVIAPDWRGFGATQPPSPVDTYWFADYFADLEVLLDHYAGDGHPVDMVGHSMGGNVAMLYAGIRPERIRRLVNLEGFGLPDGRPEQAPKKLRTWLNETAQRRNGEITIKPYASREAVAQRLMKTNPRLSLDKALWLAGVWAKQALDGQWHLLVDPAHKISSHTVYRTDEALAIYREITAPVLAIEATECSLTSFWGGRYTLEQYHQRLAQIRQHTIKTVDDAGHNLQHDQPELIAQWMKTFFA
ncbi:alpha/beta hydrolase [Lampropedia puyangensis]|uniref:Alpha/beta hydrolase n=1 Tax=Lampropedia puyangensis TaxID=1330072 RepID=A0A4S8FAC5_9BURK|nr:alpha/beta hydrolase [Lampropedia puyangensis]THU04523.1 alpha/beta hydrolase [Lampropedia puyangensis]